MINCTHADSLIQRGVDGRLSSAERAHLDAHLARCADCRVAWAEYRLLGQTASAWARPPASGDDLGDAFTARVMASIAAGPVPRLALPSWAMLALAGSALTALSFWAGLSLPVFVSPIPLTGFFPAHAASAPTELWQTLRHIPLDARGAWGMISAPSISPPPWAGSALAIALGLNVFFAWRTRHQREAAAR